LNNLLSFIIHHSLFLVRYSDRFSACSFSNQQHFLLSYFQPPSPSLIHLNNTTYRKESPNHNDCCRALAGQTGGAVRVGLELLALPFVSRQKVAKTETRKKKH
jgi:hypothetical protein